MEDSIALSNKELCYWYEAAFYNFSPIVFGSQVDGNVGISFRKLGVLGTATRDKRALRWTFKDFLKDLEQIETKETGKKKTSSYHGATSFVAKRRRHDCAHHDLESDVDDASETDHPDKISFQDPEVVKAVERLHDCLQSRNWKCWSKICERKDLSEKELIVAIGVHLVKKLTGGAYTKEDVARTECPCGCHEKLEVADMCIGLPDIWHGELDLMSQGGRTSVTCTKSIDETESEGVSCRNLEVKTDLQMQEPILSQLIGESIVFSFTEYNRNPSNGPLIPSVLISNCGFAVCIYDSEEDEMYLPIGYARLYQGGKPECKTDFYNIFLLWICLNHHLFFRKSLNGRSYTKTGFQKGLSVASLEKYMSLKDFRKQLEVNRSQGGLVLTLFDDITFNTNVLKALRRTETNSQ